MRCVARSLVIRATLNAANTTTALSCVTTSSAPATVDELLSRLRSHTPLSTAAPIAASQQPTPPQSTSRNSNDTTTTTTSSRSVPQSEPQSSASPLSTRLNDAEEATAVDWALLARHALYQRISSYATSVWQEAMTKDGDTSTTEKAVSVGLLEAVLLPLLSVTATALRLSDVCKFFPFLANHEKQIVQHTLPQLRTSSQSASVYVGGNTEDPFLIDSTIETFLRRVYPALHVSWEPVQVVRARLGMTTLRTRDVAEWLHCRAGAYVEVAVLIPPPHGLRSGALKHHEIRSWSDVVDDSDAVLLARRRLSLSSAIPPELSVVEANRMTGAPFVKPPSKKQVTHATLSGAGFLFDLFSQSTVQALSTEEGQRDPIKAITSLEPLEQTLRAKLSEFSVPRSFLSTPSAEGQPQQRPSSLSSMRKQNTDTAAAPSSPPAVVSQRLVHDQRVKIVMIKKQLDAATAMDAQQKERLAQLLVQERRELHRMMGTASPAVQQQQPAAVVDPTEVSHKAQRTEVAHGTPKAPKRHPRGRGGGGGGGRRHASKHPRK